MSRDHIPGWATFVWIYDEWLASKPRPGAICIEVGVALGKTITYVADKLIATGRTDIQLWAVDPWAGWERNGEQQEMADGVGGDFTLFGQMMLAHDKPAWELIRVVRAPSVQAARLFDDQSVDLVTLDGDHTYPSVVADLDAWIPKLRPDGWIGGDDHHKHHATCGVTEACQERFGAGNYEVNLNNQWNWGTWLRRP